MSSGRKPVTKRQVYEVSYIRDGKKVVISKGKALNASLSLGMKARTKNQVLIKKKGIEKVSDISRPKDKKKKVIRTSSGYKIVNL